MDVYYEVVLTVSTGSANTVREEEHTSRYLSTHDVCNELIHIQIVNINAVVMQVTWT